MATETAWSKWFAWRPVRDTDGFWHWLSYVERRRITESETLAPFAQPCSSSWWQYRAYWAVDHRAQPFQKRVLEWLMACFSMEICRDQMERNHRFLEESLELVQSLGCTSNEAHQLVDYVFGRPAGDPAQELGGVQVTLAALCFPAGLDMVEAAETELARVWTCIDKIRAKHAAKPKHSPLPMKAPNPE